MNKKKTKQKKGFLARVKESAVLCFSDYRYFISSCALDILFFFLFALVYSFFSIRIMGHLIDVSGIMGGLGSDITTISQGFNNETAMMNIMAKEQILAENFKAVALLAAGALLS